MTEPSGPGSWTPRGPAGPAAPAGRSSRRTPGRLPVGLAVALVVLVAVAVVVQLVVSVRRDATPLPAGTPATGSVVPVPELVGEWSGEGTLARCAGFEQGCPRTLAVTVTIDCPSRRCTVTPFDRRYGSPPLAAEDGSYQAAGPLPAELAPTCGRVPSSTALWRLDLTVRDGRLVGSYAESTLQGFDCGGTGVAWDVVLERS